MPATVFRPLIADEDDTEVVSVELAVAAPAVTVAVFERVPTKAPEIVPLTV